MKALMLSFCLAPYILISQVVWTNYNTQNSDLTYNVVFTINESIYDEIIMKLIQYCNQIQLFSLHFFMAF